jgi:hypothetical protein
MELNFKLIGCRQNPTQSFFFQNLIWPQSEFPVFVIFAHLNVERKLLRRDMFMKCFFPTYLNNLKNIFHS